MYKKHLLIRIPQILVDSQCQSLNLICSCQLHDVTHAAICLRNDAAGWVSGLEARTGGIVIGHAHSPATDTDAQASSHAKRRASRVQFVTTHHVLLGEAKAVAVADGGGGFCGSAAETISTIITINAHPLRTLGHSKCNLLAVRMMRERDRFHPGPLTPLRANSKGGNGGKVAPCHVDRARTKWPRGA